MSINLGKYICTLPFTHLTIHNDKEQYFCCKQWLDVPLDFENGWNGKDAQEVRDSMFDGTFKHCSSTNCPHLSTLVNLGYTTKGGPIVKKKDLKKLNYEGPKSIRFTFDSACNLACPSCRKDFIKNTDNITNESKIILDQIYEKYGKTVESVSLSGYGDPFYSHSMMEFLINVNKKKLPNLKHIHLHTNALLWNESNWNKIKNSHHYISSAEISIDAASDETYKKVRRGGNWVSLIKNLNYINTIDEIKSVIVSFVLQKDNYHEIYDFYKIMDSIFKNKDITFQYHSIQDWGVMKKQDYTNAKVWDKTHVENEKFLVELDKIKKLNDHRIVISMD
jgi:MoaA/NifB/PqqE/SkfB family radical SAM enzyme